MQRCSGRNPYNVHAHAHPLEGVGGSLPQTSYDISDKPSFQLGRWPWPLRPGSTTGEGTSIEVAMTPAAALLRCWSVLVESFSQKVEHRPRAGSVQGSVIRVGSAMATESLAPLDLKPGLALYNLDLHTGNTLEKLRSYYGMCSKSTELFVTTSCFAAWKKAKCTNGSAKLIPAVPARENGSGDSCCVFFFDDNINLHLGSSAGAAGTKGICNLRDITTGEYIDFSIGNNGFVRERAYQHTLIHHSSKYRNVLVQANILEAMSNDDYFTSIIERYARAGEKLIVYMDVNGTILWSDSIMGLGPSELVLEAMYGFAQVRPRRPFEFKWRDQPPIKLERPQMLKQLMHELSDNDKEVFHSFLNTDICCELLQQLSPNANLGWSQHEGSFSPEDFLREYEGYMTELRKHDGGKDPSAHGITESWFRCLRQLEEGGHAAVINSFGMDTQRVVVRSSSDAKRVMHVAINFEMWSDRDASKYAAQFQEEGKEAPDGAAKPTQGTTLVQKPLPVAAGAASSELASSQPSRSSKRRAVEA